MKFELLRKSLWELTFTLLWEGESGAYVGQSHVAEDRFGSVLRAEHSVQLPVLSSAFGALQGWEGPGIHFLKFPWKTSSLAGGHSRAEGRVCVCLFSHSRKSMPS